jgi:dolichol-phosphate mannosyltransferase
MNSLVIIPTYNEKNNIQKIAEKVLSLDNNFKVLIVDDNSPDGTGILADELSRKHERVSVLHRTCKLGLGTAYVEGFKYALSKDDIAYVFEMDADFQHDPNDLLRMRDGLIDAEVVVGSRYKEGIRVRNWELSRLFVSKLANMFVSFIIGIPVYDSTAGFIGYKKEVLKSIDIEGIATNGYGFQIEMKYKANKKGFKIKEIPIVFHGRREGESKFDFKIIKEAFFLVWKLRCQ